MVAGRPGGNLLDVGGGVGFRAARPRLTRIARFSRRCAGAGDGSHASGAVCRPLGASAGRPYPRGNPRSAARVGTPRRRGHSLEGVGPPAPTATRRVGRSSPCEGAVMITNGRSESVIRTTRRPLVPAPSSETISMP